MNTNNLPRFILDGIRPVLSAAAVLTLTACGDGGGAAGDEGPTNNAENSARAVEPVVGLWNLPGDWSGEENDEAYLLINEPGADGMAEAIVYDFDDASTGLGRNCYSIEGLPGSVVQSLSNELFLDVSAFPDAVVALTASGELTITFSEIDPATGASASRTITAQPIGIASNPIEPLC